MSRNMRWLLIASLGVIALVVASCATPTPPQAEVECFEDSDCPDGQHCCEDANCHDCCEDKHCDWAEECVDGECSSRMIGDEEGPDEIECDSDDDCGDGLYCCDDATCHDCCYDMHCDQGENCDEYECVPKVPPPAPEAESECFADADCLVSEQCDLTETPPACVPLPCNDDEECPVFWGCDLTATDPVCIPLNCDDDGDCPYGACTDNLCVPLGCDDDGDCLVAERCDLAGTPPVCIPSPGERTVAGVGCTVNQDCEDLYGPGWECKRDAYGGSPAECQEAESECFGDEDCDKGLRCFDNVCGECATNDDCDGGVCDDGECVECSSNDDCGEAERCVEDVCIPWTCDPGCGADEWCNTGQAPPECAEYGIVRLVVLGEPGEEFWVVLWDEEGPPPPWLVIMEQKKLCEKNALDWVHGQIPIPGATADRDGSCTITLPTFTMSWWTILGRSLGDERSPSGICALRASEWYEVTEEMRRLGAQIDVPGVRPVFECIPGCAGLQ